MVEYLNELGTASFCGIWSVIWVHELTQPSQIFAPLAKWWFGLPDTLCTKSAHIEAHRWISKPLFECHICHAGQAGFWTAVVGVMMFDFSMWSLIADPVLAMATARLYYKYTT